MGIICALLEFVNVLKTALKHHGGQKGSWSLLVNLGQGGLNNPEPIRLGPILSGYELT